MPRLVFSLILIPWFVLAEEAHPVTMRDLQVTQNMFDRINRDKGFPVQPNNNLHGYADYQPLGHLQLRLNAGLFNQSRAANIIGEESFYLSAENVWETNPLSKNYGRVDANIGYLSLKSSFLSSDKSDSAIKFNALVNDAIKASRSKDGKYPGALDLLTYESPSQRDHKGFLSATAEYARVWNAPLVMPFNVWGVGTSVAAEAITGSVPRPQTSFDSAHLSGIRNAGTPDFMVFPNVQTDITGLLGYQAKKYAMRFALFLGESQNPTIFSNRPARDFLQLHKTDASYSDENGRHQRYLMSESRGQDMVSFNFQHTPHLGFGVSGRPPILRGAFFELNSDARLNMVDADPQSLEQKYDLRVAVPLKDGNAIEANVGFDRENSDWAEYLRQRGRLGGRYYWPKGYYVGVEAQAEHMRYGLAEIEPNFSVVTHFGVDDSVFADKLGMGINGTAYIAEDADGRDIYHQDAYGDREIDYSKVQEEFNRVRAMLEQLPDQQGIFYQIFFNSTDENRVQLQGALCQAARQVYTREEQDACAWLNRNMPVINIFLLASQNGRVNQQMVENFGKHMILGFLNEQKITPSNAIAVAAIGQQRLTPIFGLLAKDRDTFSQWLLYQILRWKNNGEDVYDNDGRLTTGELVYQLLKKVPAQDAELLWKDYYFNRLDDFAREYLKYVFQVARKEMNEAFLQLLRAGEELNPIFVNQGQKTSDISRHALYEAWDRNSGDGYTREPKKTAQKKEHFPKEMGELIARDFLETADKEIGSSSFRHVFIPANHLPYLAAHYNWKVLREMLQNIESRLSAGGSSNNAMVVLAFNTQERVPGVFAWRENSLKPKTSADALARPVDIIAIPPIVGTNYKPEAVMRQVNLAVENIISRGNR